VTVEESAPGACAECGSTELRRSEDVLDTWFSSALWPFATLGWPEDTPDLRAFYPGDLQTTAREIIRLWENRMIFSGLELLGEVPFTDVIIHSTVLARDGRRMSKSLGTGIDPLDAISEHGADALRFGLMAMSSSQDVRYSLARVEQGRDLANKLWNASRLVLMNAQDVEPAPRPETVEDRWIVSRLQRVIADITGRMDAYEFSRGALDLYAFLWSEFCDWYLEMVKPRLYEERQPSGAETPDGSAERSVSATVLYVLEEMLALLHPLMPFVTEEVYGFVPGREGLLAVRAFPIADEALIDDAAEREVEAVKEATQSLRRYRDDLGLPPGTRIPARIVAADETSLALYERALGTLSRLARFELQVSGPDGALGEATISIPGATVDVHVDAGDARAQREEQKRTLRQEIERAQGKLANAGFVEKAPPDVVQQERDKLERFQRELTELER
jgi:valyl-tRNA synthetase